MVIRKKTASERANASISFVFRAKFHDTITLVNYWKPLTIPDDVQAQFLLVHIISTWCNTIASPKTQLTDTIQHIPKYNSLCLLPGRGSINIFCQNMKINIIRDAFFPVRWLSFIAILRFKGNSQQLQSSNTLPGHHLLSRRTSHRKISWSLEATRFGFRLF